MALSSSSSCSTYECWDYRYVSPHWVWFPVFQVFTLLTFCNLYLNDYFYLVIKKHDNSLLIIKLSHGAISFKLIYLFSMYVHMPRWPTTHVFRSEDNLQKVILSTHHMCSGDWTQIISLGRRSPYLLSQLASPHILFLCMCANLCGHVYSCVWGYMCVHVYEDTCVCSYIYMCVHTYGGQEQPQVSFLGCHSLLSWNSLTLACNQSRRHSWWAMETPGSVYVQFSTTGVASSCHKTSLPVLELAL